MSSPVAIICSDIHLSDSPPAARSAEPDWYEAMKRPLLELAALKKDLAVPVIVAGDIFHKWNPSPRLINFAIEHMPFCFAVPGQHDLRYHSLSDIKFTGFWTLVEAGKLTYTKPGKPLSFGFDWNVWGFPWGTEIEKPMALGNHLAVVHMFVCSKDTAYPGAPEDAFYPQVRKKFRGFDAAAFGDNHKPFESNSKNGCTIFNCGALIRRTQPERAHSPSVGIFYEDGKIARHFLDCSGDLFSDALIQQERAIPDMAEFLDGLKGAETGSEDFRSSVERWASREEIKPKTKKLLLGAIDSGD